MMKLYIVLATVLGAFASKFVTAAPLVTVGDVGTISFDGSAIVKFDDNIFRQEQREVDDVVVVFSPGFVADIGRNSSDLDLSLSTSLDFVRYQDKGELDSELFHINGNGAYRSSRLMVMANASFDESKSNNDKANRDEALLERETTRFGVNVEYTLSPKFSAQVGLDWEETAYVGNYAANYENRKYRKIPLDIFYELTPKLDLSVGYTNGDIDVETSDDATTDNFNVGLRGQLLPKLMGNLKIGYNNYDSATRDTASMSLDADLNWTVSSKISHKLNLYRNFDASATGTGTQESKIRFSSTYMMNDKISLSGRIGYNMREYLNSSREDDLLTLGVNGSYRLNRHWNLNAGYVFSENDSTLAGSSYDNNIITFSALLSY
jgi:hypothetical protein